MDLSKNNISIAITVFRRMRFLEQALASAVHQTVPVKVVLHDDGCDDQPGLENILRSFGGKVEHRRAASRHGLFQNMNRCIWESPTPWVSILHDDDLLERDFVEKVLAVAPSVERCALFCGGTTYIDREGYAFYAKNPVDPIWESVPPEKMALANQFGFPGQLIHVTTAKSVGGFPENSIYTGDWELWFKLTLAGGAVQLGTSLGRYRSHDDSERGTTAANRTGRKIPCCGAQVKRNLSRLASPSHRSFDRIRWINTYGPQYRDLLPHAWHMPGWLLRYNRRILLQATRSTLAVRLLGMISRMFGNPGIRLAALGFRAVVHFGIGRRQQF